ncbi:GNAT family N-acetyltransferase [Nisaea nitritireducens]|uniref:GNAT family N-acetyltransferase n=1 Tax=Nisaea nitritireducens TaxID=568392 RepID=UPI00385778D5
MTLAGETAFSVRALGQGDEAAFLALRREALTGDPTSFAAAPEDDFLRTEEDARQLFARRNGDVVFGAFTDRLCGMAGLYREQKQKTRHKVHVWSMYVAPVARELGAGRALMEIVIAHAGTLDGVTDIHLSVSEQAGPARSLYDSLGFSVWGVEPEGLIVQGVSVPMQHMILPLP